MRKKTGRGPRAAKGAAPDRGGGIGRGGGAQTRALEHDDPAGVEALLSAMDPSQEPLVRAVREAILGVSSGISEGVKWNSPSFYCEGWFATIKVRGGKRSGGGGVGGAGILVVLHHGAKARGGGFRETIKDPMGLLHWHAPDRASLALESEEALRERKRALGLLVAQWAREQRRLARDG